MRSRDPLLYAVRWLRSRSNRALVLIIPYLAALASILSFVFRSGGSGMPSRLEIGLLSISIVVAFFLAMDLLGNDHRVE
ncbi:MAG: hypothetical protein ABEJ71_00725 [Halodesulfurarchaeum sp.]